MGTESLQHISDVFSRRFFLNALLPTLIFATALALVIMSTATTFEAVFSWWRDLEVLGQIVAVLLYVASVYFLAVAVASQWRGIVRLYEGYPLCKLMRVLKLPTPGKRWHQQKLDSLHDYSAHTPHGNPLDSYYRYPAPGHRERVLPTQLGNILLSGERYAKDRYGIESIIFWPRLHPLLPESFQKEHESFLINYEFPLVISFQAMFTGLVGGATILLGNGDPLMFLCVFAGGAILAYLAYLASLSSAEELAEQQRVAFDLYRGNLMDAWPTVADVADEREAFRSIYQFVVLERPPAWAEPQERRSVRRMAPSSTTEMTEAPLSAAKVRARSDEDRTW